MRSMLLQPARKAHSTSSPVGRGLVRLDLVQARLWCQACGTTLVALAEAVEQRIAALPAAARQKRPRVAKKTGVKRRTGEG